MGWRAGAKSIAERLLVVSGAAGLSRASHASGTLILAYHDIVPDGAESCGDRSLHLPQREFAAQLDLLAATHDIVPLEAALAGAHASRRPRAVVTFDDAYRGAVTAGVEELAARGLPAAIFVSPAFVADGTFWWDALTPPGAPALDAALRARALEEWQGRDTVVRDGAAALGMRPAALPPHARCASEAELARATAHAGITLGSHSWSHANLARLDADELRTELSRPLGWLRERFERVLPVLSYPYGLASAATERAARDAGYIAALRIDGGWVPREPVNPFAIPRLNIPAAVSHDGFVLRVAGVLG